MKYAYFMLVLCFIGCRKDTLGDSDAALIWKHDNPCSGRLASGWDPILYKDVAIYGWNPYRLDAPYDMPIEARDKNTGVVKWVWKDYITDVEAGSGIGANVPQHVFGNVLVFALSTALYAIDMDNGQTLWKQRLMMNGGYLRSLGSTFFNTVHDLDRTAYHIVKGDTWTGALDTIFSYEKNSDYWPTVFVPFPYINDVGDTILVFSVIAYHPVTPLSDIYFYNMSADTLAMKYDSTDNAAGGNNVLVEDGKVFFGGRKVSCYDANTYQKLWERDNPKGMGTIGFLLKGNMLFYGTEDLDQDLFAVNAATGDKIWRAKSGGLCSWMSYHNDVIYYNSGGDGKMHCVEASTGRVLGEFDAPGYKRNSDDFFTRGLSIDPATGRIYTASYLSALCFEPLQ